MQYFQGTNNHNPIIPNRAAEIKKKKDYRSEIFEKNIRIENIKINRIEKNDKLS